MLLSRLLDTRPIKLTAASNEGVYEKLAIVDEYLVDHCSMATTDRLDDRFSLSYLSRRRPHVGAVNNISMNGTARHGYASINS